MTDASVSTEGGRTCVRLERHFVDPPAIVWRALTERDQLRTWFPCDVVVDGGRWVVGARITFIFPPEVIDITLSGEVIDLEEPSRLAYRWGDEVLRFELSEDHGGTLLVLFDELPPSFAARNAAGWDDCLDRLVGKTAPASAWREHFNQYQRDLSRFSVPRRDRRPSTREASEPLPVERSHGLRVSALL
jgi:uncharacterized protein YndB with AHSA1/START domain